MNASQTPSDVFIENVRESLLLKQALLNDLELIAMAAKVGEELIRALGSGKKVLLFGNGGSAADAQHLAAELVGRFDRERRSLPAIALTTDTSVLTAISNDYSYESVFARQLEALGMPGDVAIGISTSGSSPNVVSGIRTARKAGVITVGMTGPRGRELALCADHSICIPSLRTPRIQKAHILVGHILCEIVEAGLFPDASASGLARNAVTEPGGMR
jgi:D-sedoheptulose 7-phosphate isomerase